MSRDDLEKFIQDQVKQLTDDEINFAYWRDYADDQGLYERAIDREYRRLGHRHGNTSKTNS